MEELYLIIPFIASKLFNDQFWLSGLQFDVETIKKMYPQQGFCLAIASVACGDVAGITRMQKGQTLIEISAFVHSALTATRWYLVTISLQENDVNSILPDCICTATSGGGKKVLCKHTCTLL
jgi:hypothetical protein